VPVVVNAISPIEIWPRLSRDSIQQRRRPEKFFILAAPEIAIDVHVTSSNLPESRTASCCGRVSRARTMRKGRSTGREPRIVIRNIIDSRIYGISPHQPSVARLQEFRNVTDIIQTGIEP
jgi:hypothetical protein